MKTLFTVVWYLIRIVYAIARFLLMKLVFAPLLYFVRPFFAALRYLTIVPVPRWLGGGRRKDLRRSLVHVPLAGVVLGGMVGAFAWCVPHLFPELITSALIVVALIVLSGGRTLGGLARSADGLLGPDPKRDMLEASGPPAALRTAGVAAVVCVLMVKFAALGAIEKFPNRWRAAVLAPLAGRCAIVVAMSILTCIPKGGPPGRVLFRKRSTWGGILCAVWAAALLGAAATVFYGFEKGPDGYALRPEWVVQGAVAAGLSVGAALLAAWFVRRRLGGATGDALGAISEIAEVVMVVVLSAQAILGFILGPIDTRPPEVSPAEEAQWFLLGPMLG